VQRSIASVVVDAHSYKQPTLSLDASSGLLALTKGAIRLSIPILDHLHEVEAAQ